MTDYILIDGDTVLFMPNFGAAIVVVQPGTLAGSGPATMNGKTICIEGDEQNVEVPGCQYVAPPYVIPGTGTLKIDSLAGDQVATKTLTGDTAVMLKGGQFTAKFEVQSPAQQPPPGPGSPIPDSTTQYTGQGSFVNSNTKFQGT
jgi:hypothetical protein